MRKKFFKGILCIFCLAAAGLVWAEDFEMTSTPDDLYTFIQELHTRNYDDTLLDKVELFLKLYPAHDYSDPVQQIKIAVLNRHQRHAETIDAIRHYLEQYPNSPQREAYLRLEGACRFNQKDYAKAADCFHKLIETTKTETIREDATLALATCQRELKNDAEALKLYQSLVALPLADKHPSRLQARVQYINILQAEGNRREALQICLELLNFNATPPALRHAILIQAANLAYMLGDDLPLAERLYATFLVEVPQDANASAALRQLCFCKFRLKKFEEFLELAQRYRTQVPAAANDQQLDFDTIEALMNLNRHQEALPFLAKIINAPENDENVLKKARYYEFTALAALQRDDEVLARGDAFLEDYPNFPYKTAILRQLVVSSAKAPEARPRTRAYLETLLPLLAGDRETAYQYGFLLAQLYEADKLWTLAADLLEKLANDANATQRPTLLMRAAQNADQIPDFNRSKRLLDAVRAMPDLSTENYVMASEMLYQSASHADKEDTAFQTARETLEKTSGREHTVWLTRMGNHFLQAKQYDQAANCYGQALAMPELPGDARTRLLPTQLRLLLVGKRTEELFALLPEFFASAHLPLPPQSCEELADYCSANHRPDFAKSAWERLRLQPDATEPQLLHATLRLAELELLSAPENAKQRLETLAKEYERQGKSVPADAYAILAEIYLRAKEYDLTLMNVDRALEKDRPAVFTTRTATRAWWVKAQYLYECRHDLAAAKSTAALAGILKTDEVYSPLALQLTIRILREQHQDRAADEEEARLRQKFPDFQHPQ